MSGRKCIAAVSASVSQFRTRARATAPKESDAWFPYDMQSLKFFGMILAWAWWAWRCFGRQKVHYDGWSGKEKQPSHRASGIYNDGVAGHQKLSSSQSA